MAATYLENIFVTIYQNQGAYDIYLLESAQTGNNQLDFQVLDQANFEQGEMKIDENGIVCIINFERQYADNSSEINIYSYNDQNYLLADNIDPQFLRSLYGQGYQLQLSNPSLIQTSANIFNMQEYIAIPAINSNNDSVILIFRIYQVNSQNQLYCSIPVDPNIFNISFFGNKLIGFINTNIDMDYKISQQKFNQDFQFTMSTQILIDSNLKNLKKITQEDQHMIFNFKFQKNLASQQGYINRQSDGILSLQNYYDSQVLKVNDLYYFNDFNTYYGNFLGWQITYSLNNIDLKMYLQNSLISKQNNGINAYDTILFGEIIVMTYQNKLIFQNIFSMNLGQNLDYCYLQTDESSIMITLDPLINKNIIKQTFFTLCLNKQDSSTQQFNKITVLQQPQMYSQDPQIQIISNQSWISTSIQFDKNVQVLNKISNDPNLGLIALIQQPQIIGQSICQIVLSDQEEGQFTFNCSVYEKMRLLKLVYFMWSYQCQSNIFFTQDGFAYYQISKNFDSFQVINIKDILNNLNYNVDQGSQVSKMIFNKQQLFENIKCIEYFTEPNYIFKGFASQSSNQSQINYPTLQKTHTNIRLLIKLSIMAR
ncbi:hypothetical protein TTHERM_00068060 (macronuclear) [Tetrahymena thermophila SB210]|uniref:Uncharacterized protein n=1 Tax=Tetrahymena thermophila (strain SB210) TaxID=312017 RepID=I7M6Y5_TETTS|nr:hypothetical protein TTHERM_00068060 [Tetrahymena thermophila SB210]EAR87498.2 hypothetical protein TTHERM_00068060 [Tetrahymena thermophila SB210]|eukprot:XP_001007743.2 hypothetical protein TTHERM_00068060 [Tetrahymena thermophila SB210]